MQRHAFDIVSAGFGAIFVWLGIVAILPDVTVPISTIWPILAVLAGVALLVSAIRRDQEEEEPSEY